MSVYIGANNTSVYIGVHIGKYTHLYSRRGHVEHAAALASNCIHESAHIRHIKHS